MSKTQLTQHIAAPRDAVYRALIDAQAVAIWMVPDDMHSQVHVFEPHEGGQFRISLTYESPTASGKSSAHTDTYHGHFAKLVPNQQVIQVMEFETDDAAMRGEMTVTFNLIETDHGTDVFAVHENVPAGIAPSDNELGWLMSLQKLARWVESKVKRA